MRRALACLLALAASPSLAATVVHGSGAEYWDDVVVSALSVRVGGTAPGFEEWTTHAPLYAYFFDPASDESVFGSLQLPHRWDGGAINFHVHWFPEVVSDGDPANQVPEWRVDYAFVDIGVVSPVLVTASCATTPLPADATIAQDRHYITILPTITPSADQNTGSAILYFRLWRNGDGGNDTAEMDAGLLSVDAHFRSARLGSRTAEPE